MKHFVFPSNLFTVSSNGKRTISKHNALTFINSIEDFLSFLRLLETVEKKDKEEVLKYKHFTAQVACLLAQVTEPFK